MGPIKFRRVHGVTVHKLVRQIDAGDILVQKKYKIQPFQSLGELFKALAVMSGEMIEEVIELLKKTPLILLNKMSLK